jgi:hypothetical protein
MSGTTSLGTGTLKLGCSNACNLICDSGNGLVDGGLRRIDDLRDQHIERSHNHGQYGHQDGHYYRAHCIHHHANGWRQRDPYCYGFAFSGYRHGYLLFGTTSLGTGTLSSGVATLATSFAAAGTDSLTAVYAGSTTYATSTSSAVSITVSPGTTLALRAMSSTRLRRRAQPLSARPSTSRTPEPQRGPVGRYSGSSPTDRRSSLFGTALKHRPARW